MIRVLASRCIAMFRRRSLDRELDDEMRAHIDVAIEEKVQGGMSPDQARRAAMLEFGAVTQIKRVTASIVASAGLAFGVAGAIALTRQMDKLLFSVSPTDPTVLICVGILLVAVAMIACILPARRAASIHPIRVLRTE